VKTLFAGLLKSCCYLEIPNFGCMSYLFHQDTRTVFMIQKMGFKDKEITILGYVSDHVPKSLVGEDPKTA